LPISSAPALLHRDAQRPLAALHTFARFAASQAPEHLAELQRVLAIPFKRGARRAPVDFLDQKEVEALLTAPKR